MGIKTAEHPTHILGFHAGTVRAYYLATVVFLCGFKAGYDSGVAGGVLTFKSFMNDYHYTKQQRTRTNSLSVSLQQLGSFVICLALVPFLQRLGRKPAILLSSATFIVGAIIETINTHHLSAWYVGRFVAGVGLGGCSVVIPTYNSEMAPASIRGRLGSFYQWFYTLGIFLSYWVDYAVVRHVPDTASRQWQAPIGIQMVAPALLFMGTFTLPESARWLLKVGRTEDAWHSLSWIRSSTGPEVEAEFAAMRDAIEEENRVTEGLTIKEMFTPANRVRVMLGAVIFLFQQGTGASALAFFGPQFFTLLVGPGDKNILLTALFGAVKLGACTLFIFFMSERFGRRPLLVFGATGMACCHLITATVFKTRPPPGGGETTAAGKATVAMVYLAVVFYNWSWGPIPWAYVPEIWQNRTRELGMGISLAVHWLFSFVFAISTPYMMDTDAMGGFGTFLFYAVFCTVMAIWCFFFVHETRSKVLEVVNHEIDVTGVKARATVEDVETGDQHFAQSRSQSDVASDKDAKDDASR